MGALYIAIVLSVQRLGRAWHYFGRVKEPGVIVNDSGGMKVLAEMMQNGGER